MQTFMRVRACAKVRSRDKGVVHAHACMVHIYMVHLVYAAAFNSNQRRSTVSSIVKQWSQE